MMSVVKEPRKILVISHDKVGSSMAGPGIRYHMIATELAKIYDVTLAVFNPAYITDLQETTYKATDIHVQKFQSEFAKFDVIIALWLSDDMIAFAKSKGIVLVFDLYAPVPVEDLVQRVFGDKLSSDSDYDYRVMLSNYRHFVRNGDFLLVSNEQQRDFWMGYAFASDKVTPSIQSKLPIDGLFGICPMGINLSELVGLESKTDLLSKRLSTIKKDDFVVVWTGGIWDWFDAITPIKAIAKLVDSGCKNVKLVFLGTKHPNDDVPAMQETDKARALAKRLKLLDVNVFFLDGWLPYAERTRYLKRADVALYAHKPSIESRFSHRTRVLDHILMSIPTIATRGDYFSDYIELHSLGMCINPFDIGEMAESISNLASNESALREIRRNIQAAQVEFTWEVTLKPLVDFLGLPLRPSTYIAHPSEGRVDVQAPVLRHIKKVMPSRLKQVIKRALY